MIFFILIILNLKKTPIRKILAIILIYFEILIDFIVTKYIIYHIISHIKFCCDVTVYQEN